MTENSYCPDTDSVWDIGGNRTAVFDTTNNFIRDKLPSPRNKQTEQTLLCEHMLAVLAQCWQYSRNTGSTHALLAVLTQYWVYTHNLTDLTYI